MYQSFIGSLKVLCDYKTACPLRTGLLIWKQRGEEFLILVDEATESMITSQKEVYGVQAPVLPSVPTVLLQSQTWTSQSWGQMEQALISWPFALTTSATPVKQLQDSSSAINGAHQHWEVISVGPKIISASIHLARHAALLTWYIQTSCFSSLIYHRSGVT